MRVGPVLSSCKTQDGSSIRASALGTQWRTSLSLTHHPLVAELVVLVGFRGQGIGRALLRAVVSGERLVEDVECW